MSRGEGSGQKWRHVEVRRGERRGGEETENRVERVDKVEREEREERQDDQATRRDSSKVLAVLSSFAVASIHTTTPE